MDHTHEEFVALLGEVRASVQSGEFAQALAVFERLIDHTVEHFAREDGWMQVIGLRPDNAHTLQHKEVLQFMREVARMAGEQGFCAPLAMAVDELAQWFPLHARMMDADLVLCMRKVGFDPSTSRPARAEAGSNASRP